MSYSLRTWLVLVLTLTERPWPQPVNHWKRIERENSRQLDGSSSYGSLPFSRVHFEAQLLDRQLSHFNRRCCISWELREIWLREGRLQSVWGTNHCTEQRRHHYNIQVKTEASGSVPNLQILVTIWPSSEKSKNIIYPTKQNALIYTNNNPHPHSSFYILSILHPHEVTYTSPFAESKHPSVCCGEWCSPPAPL